jgi:TolC family type I secretion outer membrane protein
MAATHAAYNRVQAARARLLSTEQDVLLAAVTAYMNVLRDQAVLDLNVNNEQVLRRQLEATEDRFRVGEVTRTDVSQAQARLAGATADRIQAESDLEASRATFANVIGMPPGNVTVPELPTDLPQTGEAANDTAARFNPNVVAAQFDERAAYEDTREVRGQLLPSLNLEGTASHSLDSSGDDSEVTRYRAIVALTVPLYQKGAVYSRLREARQNLAEFRDRIDVARRDAIENSTRAWEQFLAARAQIEALRAQVTANEVALEGVQREAEVGSRTVLDVLDAEQELLDSRVNLVTARRGLAVAVYDLKSSIGQLTARLLDLPVELYDPEMHYQEVRGKWFGGRASGGAENASSP